MSIILRAQQSASLHSECSTSARNRSLMSCSFRNTQPGLARCEHTLALLTGSREEVRHSWTTDEECRKIYQTILACVWP